MAAYTEKTDAQKKDFRIAIIRLLQKYGVANEDNGDMNNALNSLITNMET